MKDKNWKDNIMNIEKKLYNFFNELNEETYDLDDLEPFVDFIVKKIKAPAKKKFDVTRFFKKFLKNPNQKVYFLFKSNDRSGLAQVATDFGGEIAISVDKEMFKTIKDKAARKEMLKRALRHESVHALDFLRSKIKPQEEDPSEKIKAKKNTFLSYFLDTMEFNRAMSELARSKKKNDYVWDEFYNSENLTNAIYAFLSSQAFAYPDKKENIKKDIIQVLKDPNIKKRIVKRLTRENLLPEFMEKK